MSPEWNTFPVMSKQHPNSQRCSVNDDSNRSETAHAHILGAWNTSFLINSLNHNVFITIGETIVRLLNKSAHWLDC